MTSEELREKANGLRRAVQYGVENGKKNIVVDLDVLADVMDVTIPSNMREKFRPTVEELDAILNSPDKAEIVVQNDGSCRAEIFDPTAPRDDLYNANAINPWHPDDSQPDSMESQRNDEAWMHAACLTIAETGQRWGENVKPSLAMDAVYRLRLQHDNLIEAAREARAALYGCREVLGSVANIQHAIDLLNKATSGLNYVKSPGFEARELTLEEHTETRIANCHDDSDICEVETEDV